MNVIAITLVLSALLPLLLLGQPKSFTAGQTITPLGQLPTVFLKEVNNDSLSAADEQLGYRNRYGIAQNVNITPETSGVWDTLGNGDRIWRIRIVSPGAVSQFFLFSSYQLSSNAELYVIDENTNYYKGPYSHHNNKPYNRHSIGSTPGSAHILELYEPIAESGENNPTLAKVYQGYQFAPPSEPNNKGKGEQILKRFSGSLTTSGACNPNVNCPYGDEWCREKYAVCLLEMPTPFSLIHCTGTLINNTANNFRPFVLSDWHCTNQIYDDDCALTENEKEWVEDWVFVFNWWANPNSDCANSGTLAQALANINGKEYSGGIFRAGYRPTDMLLVEILSTDNGGEFDVPPTREFYYAGWSRSETLPTQATILHHPSGDVMKFAQCYTASNIVAEGKGHDCADGYLDGNRPITSNNWQVEWDIGHGEPGTSGSAMFDQDHYIRGQLTSHAENFNCSLHERWATFGKFHVSWDGGGTYDTQLSYWLDLPGHNLTKLRGLYKTIQLYNRYTYLDDKQLEISNPAMPVSYYHAPTELHLGGGKSWTTPPDGAQNNHAFQFYHEYGGDVCAGKRIVLKECLRVPPRDGAGQRVRFHIGPPQCAVGENVFGNPVKIFFEGDAGYSNGTACSTSNMAHGDPIERTNSPTIPFVAAAPRMTLIPNPADGYVDVRISGGQPGGLTVMSAMGAAQYAPASGQSQAGAVWSVRLDVSHLPAGVYYISAPTVGQTLTQPLIIIR